MQTDNTRAPGQREITGPPQKHHWQGGVLAWHGLLLRKGWSASLANWWVGDASMATCWAGRKSLAALTLAMGSGAPAYTALPLLPSNRGLQPPCFLDTTVHASSLWKRVTPPPRHSPPFTKAQGHQAVPKSPKDQSTAGVQGTKGVVVLGNISLGTLQATLKKFYCFPSMDPAPSALTVTVNIVLAEGI